MFEKITLLNDEEKNLLIFVLIQRIAGLVKLDQELILTLLLNDTDSFMQFADMLKNYT